MRASRHDRLLLAAAGVCFWLSGFAALVYQTAWLRQFAVVFGTSELAVVAVLAAYMAGLALGAALAARFVGRLTRPILAYGLLEAGVGVAALTVPWLLAAASAAYVGLLGGQPVPPNAAATGQPLFYLAVAFVVLAVPTGCMGATLPLLTRHVVRSDREVGPRVALLYAVNTFGAVIGTLVSAFVLLPAFGLRATVWVGAGVNVLVFAVAALLARAPLDEPPVVTQAPSEEPAIAARFAWILPLICLSGMAAFLYEVLWTRLLAHVLGGSLYAFATMLAAFLTGIALGGAVASRAGAERSRACTAFVVAQVAVALLSMLIYSWLEAFVPAVRSTGSLALYAALVMLPATVFIGATVPLAVRILSPRETAVAVAAGRVYAWNTVGAIVGAVGAGFFLIPALGFEGALKLGVLVNLVLALAAAWLLMQRQRVAVGVTAAAVVLVALFYAPARPERVIASSSFALPAVVNSTEIYFAVGRSATVRLTRDDGRFNLRENGLPEALVAARGMPRLGPTDQMLVALPLAARPGARSILMVGLGAGVSIEEVPASIDTIDVIELEPEVLNANRRLAGLRRSDPLADRRVNVVINDARNALRLTSKRYDLIVSQPSHPWTAGASHLFTREFASLAKARLTEGGVFVQWMSPAFIDESLLRSLAANLTGVFAHARMYYAGGAMLMLMASDGPLDVERQLAAPGRPVVDTAQYYGYLGFNGVEDFVAALLLDEDGFGRFARGAAPVTDDENRMATASHTSGDGLGGERVVSLLAPYDPLLVRDGWIQTELGPRVAFGAVAVRLLSRGQQARAARFAEAIGNPGVAALVRGLIAAASGDPAAGREAFLEALRSDGHNEQAQFALLRLEYPALTTGRTAAEARQRFDSLTGSAAAVLRGWEMLASGDVTGLAALEGALAQAMPTDLWYPEASQLRAHWRLRSRGERQQLVDALRITDRTLAIRPDADLLMLRAEVARSLEDEAAFAATVRYAVQQLDAYIEAAQLGAVPLRAADLAALLQRLEAWRDIYWETTKPTALDDEIALQIDRALERGRALGRR